MQEKALYVRDSLASSDSRKRPGMMYVRERRADSICETDEALSEIKASYLRSHERGAIANDVEAEAELVWGSKVLVDVEGWPKPDAEESEAFV